MPTVRRVSVYFGDTTPTFPAGRNVFVRYLKATILYQISTTLRKKNCATTMFPEYIRHVEVTVTITTFYVF